MSCLVASRGDCGFWGVTEELAFASRLKYSFSLESSRWTAEMEDSTSGFHSEKALSKEAAVYSRTTM
jgi:hypothetical protein